MSTLVITDETAANAALTYDTSRNLGINGTPTDRLTTNGSAVATAGAVADSSTVDSTSVSPTSGSVSIAAGATATITSSVSSRFPDAQTWYAVLNFSLGFMMQITTLSLGSFVITNTDTFGTDSAPYIYM